MILKWLFRLAIALVSAVLCIALLLVFWVDPNTFQPQIIDVVEKNTGRALTIDGQLHLKFFPHLSLAVDSLHLGNHPDFDGPFLTLKQADLKVRLWPLLRSRLEVVALNIKGLDLFLVRNAQGQGNWMDLAQTDQDQDSASDSVLQRDQRVPLMASLIVEGLHIKDTQIFWTDELKNQALEVGGLEIDVSNFAFGTPFVVRTQATARMKDLHAQVSLATKAVLELDRLDLKNVQIKGLVQGPALPQGPESIMCTADFFSTSGSLDNAHFQVLGLDLRLASQLGAEGHPSGSLQVAPFAPQDLYTRLGLDWPQFKNNHAVHQGALSCNWAWDTHKLQISDLELKVDNSTLVGDLEIIKGAEPLVTLNVHLDTVHADDYRLQAAADDQGQSLEKNLTLVIQGLDKLNVKGTLNIDELIIANIHCTQVQVHAQASQRQLILESLKTKAYGGQILASGAMDLRGARPQWIWEHKLSDMDLGPLWRDLNGQDFISGRTQSSAHLQTQGISKAELISNLSGSYDFKISQGMIHGVSLTQSIRDILQALKYKPSAPPEPRQTSFSELSAQGQLKDGLESTRQLLLSAPRFHITGHGQANLVHETIDYALTLHLNGSAGPFDAGGLLGLTSFPVRVSGPMDQPTITPDFGAVLRGWGSSGSEIIEDTFQGLRKGLQKILP